MVLFIFNVVGKVSSRYGKPLRTASYNTETYEAMQYTHVQVANAIEIRKQHFFLFLYWYFLYSKLLVKFHHAKLTNFCLYKLHKLLNMVPALFLPTRKLLTDWSKWIFYHLVYQSERTNETSSAVKVWDKHLSWLA